MPSILQIPVLVAYQVVHYHQRLVDDSWAIQKSTVSVGPSRQMCQVNMLYIGEYTVIIINRNTINIMYNNICVKICDLEHNAFFL